MIHKAMDLSPEQRLAVEGLLGRAIAEQEEVSIRVLPQAPPVPPERRREIMSGLQKHFARIDVQRQPVSCREADEIIDEALRSTRPRYQPLH